ncbi:unnamed protein product [Plutella xylostella]|uniref:(diamondback moth) hypothetical protein n=1 Tax=Plutella xylostella TaxID=51655 RepID=A0A8S4G5V2_PLUXY|nr:unnamed protein product [Plutella xylostella]
MYPSQDAKHGPLKLNPFVTQKYLDHNIMLKTIQNLYKNNGPFNMTSPFLVDNILHQQKTVNFHNQYINQQLENYVLQRQSYEQQISRENSPEMEESKTQEAEDDCNRNDESIDDTKIEHDDDSKSRDEDDTAYVKHEQPAFHTEFYRENAEKEVLNIPNLNLARRCQSCGAYDCSPFACKKSGLRRLEELEKRFMNYQENSGDESGEVGSTERKGYTDEMVRNCEEFNNEPKKPLLKFSVSAILGDREDRDSAVKSNGVNVKEFKYNNTTCSCGAGDGKHQYRAHPYTSPWPTLAKPIASRPLPLQHQHLHMLHCAHPYLAELQQALAKPIASRPLPLQHQHLHMLHCAHPYLAELQQALAKPIASRPLPLQHQHLHMLHCAHPYLADRCLYSTSTCTCCTAPTPTSPTHNESSNKPGARCRWPTLAKPIASRPLPLQHCAHPYLAVRQPQAHTQVFPLPGAFPWAHSSRGEFLRLYT